MFSMDMVEYVIHFYHKLQLRNNECKQTIVEIVQNNAVKISLHLHPIYSLLYIFWTHINRTCLVWIIGLSIQDDYGLYPYIFFILYTQFISVKITTLNENKWKHMFFFCWSDFAWEATKLSNKRKQNHLPNHASVNGFTLSPQWQNK